MGGILILLFIACLFFFVLYQFVSALDEGSHWRWDDRNPYRRYCIHCDQQQDFYQPGGWQCVGRYRECSHKDHEKEDNER